MPALNFDYPNPDAAEMQKEWDQYEHTPRGKYILLNRIDRGAPCTYQKLTGDPNDQVEYCENDEWDPYSNRCIDHREG